MKVVVEHNPRFISELKIAVCLPKRSLPVTQLGLDRNDRPKGRNVNRGDDYASTVHTEPTD